MAVNIGRNESMRRGPAAVPAAPSLGPVYRAARVAYAFVMMNYAAVAALVTTCLGRKVWR